MLEFAKHEFETAMAMRAFEIVPHGGKFARRGILKRIDRLLLVADGKNRASAKMRSGAGGEFSHKPPHDLPLLMTRVLRLVDQEMIDAEIELVVHPGGIDIGEEVASCRSDRRNREGRGALFRCGSASGRRGRPSAARQNGRDSLPHAAGRAARKLAAARR